MNQKVTNVLCCTNRWPITDRKPKAGIQNIFFLAMILQCVNPHSYVGCATLSIYVVIVNQEPPFRSHRTHCSLTIMERRFIICMCFCMCYCKSFYLQENAPFVVLNKIHLHNHLHNKLYSSVTLLFNY